MADAEHLAGDLAQPAAERGVVAAVGALTTSAPSTPSGTRIGGDRVGVPLRLHGAELQAPGGDRRAHALGQAVVAGEDVLQAFLEDQVERGAQAAQELGRRRVGEVAACRWP